MKVQVYLINARLGLKYFGLLREDDHIASIVAGSTVDIITRISYLPSYDFSCVFMHHDESIELLDTLPEEEVLDYLKFYYMMNGE